MKVKLSDAVKPNGRFSRSQFAFFYFVPILVSGVLWFLFSLAAWFVREGYIAPGFIGVPGAIAGLLLIFWLPFQVYLVIIAGIRRLHDLNLSGWYLLLAFIPFLNLIMIVYLLAAPGKVEGNRWLSSS